MSKRSYDDSSANDAIGFRYNCLDYRSAFVESVGLIGVEYTEAEKAWSGVLYHRGECILSDECTCAPQSISAAQSNTKYATIEDLLSDKRKTIAGVDFKEGYNHKRVHVAFTDEDSGKLLWQS